ncbi:MAG TPA: VCBS repeat-containing protein [Gammaproteobacteria bacterium]
MRRILPLTLLCAGASLSNSALAGNFCTQPGDPQLTFPGTINLDVFGVLPNPSGGYVLNLCSPGALDISWLTGYSFADFNHDGFEDLLLARSGNSGGEVKLFLNDKTGSGTVVFSTNLHTGAGVAPSEIDTLDLNGDGWVDIITANGSDGTFTVMLNDGHGTFTSVKQYAVASDVTVLAAVDVNGDGLPDVITESTLDKTVSVSLNKGDGTFAAPKIYPVGGSVSSLTVGDLNGDGHPDIYVSSAGVDSSVVFGSVPSNPGSQEFLNNGDGTFTASAWQPATSGSGGGSISISGGGVTVSANSSVGLLGSGDLTAPPVVVNSGTGQIKLPDTKLKVTVVTTSSGKTSAGTGSTGGSKSSATASGGGGDMEWLSLTLLGLAGFLRRKRT